MGWEAPPWPAPGALHRYYIDEDPALDNTDVMCAVCRLHTSSWDGVGSAAHLTAVVMFQRQGWREIDGRWYCATCAPTRIRRAPVLQ